MNKADLTDKEKEMIIKRRKLSEGNKGGVDFHFENFVIKQLIKNNQENLLLKTKNKLDDYEVQFIQAYRLLNNFYKAEAEDKLNETFNKQNETIVNASGKVINVNFN